MLRVVTYHRVARPEDTPLLDPALISATPEVFQLQIDHLRHCYDVISIGDVLDAISGRIRLPRRATLITFDDAYSDFASVAWPILKQWRLPATLFVPTAYPGDPRLCFWWDKLYRAAGSSKELRKHVKSLPHRQAMAFVDSLFERSGVPDTGTGGVLDWTTLRQLASEGVSLAAHSRTHPLLTRVSPEELEDEIIGSQRDLQRETGSALPIFCYPNGSVDSHIADLLRRCGFVLGFSTRIGHNSLDRADLLNLRRMDVTMRSSPGIFKLRLLRFASWMEQWRQRWRDN